MLPFTPANQTLICVLKVIHAASIKTYLASLHVQVGIAIASNLLILLKKSISTLPKFFFLVEEPSIDLIVPILPLSAKLDKYRRPRTVEIPTTCFGLFFTILVIRYSFDNVPFLTASATLSAYAVVTKCPTPEVNQPPIRNKGAN